jgi:hypothetical protein
VRHGQPGPPILGRVRLAIQLWQRLGLRLADLDAMPWPEADQIVTVIEVICREEDAQARRSMSGGR